MKDGDSWVLNGSKNFITHGSVGDVAVLMAVTDRTAGRRGISAFVVDLHQKGIHAGKKENKLGMRASDTATLVMEDCRIPAENLLGAPGEGFVQAMKVLDGGRISIAALALGIAEGAFAGARAYAQQRKQFGKAISEFQTIQNYLADMATEIDAARLLTYRAGWLKDAGRPTTKESAMAKLYASEVSVRVSNLAVQIHGGYGFTKDFGAEKYFRDAKLCTIGEGTSEIQRLVIAREVLQEAADRLAPVEDEPSFLHDEAGRLDRPDVLQRVARDGHEVAVEPGRDLADLRLHPQEARRDERRGLDRLERRHAGLDVHRELPAVDPVDLDAGVRAVGDRDARA